MKNNLNQLLQKQQMRADELETLLEARKNGEVDFTLIDIREVFEYTNSSIEGSDLLIPTSVIQGHLDKFEELKDKPVVLYCRTGTRTGNVMYALHNMGYKNIVHLNGGILSYGGKKIQNAEIPNKI